MSLSASTKVYLTITSSGGGKIDPPILPFDLAISPNPATDQITVTLTENEKQLNSSNSQSSETTYEVQLWSSMGIIKSVKSDGQPIQFSLSSLPAGTYYIRVISKDRVGSKLFFKR